MGKVNLLVKYCLIKEKNEYNIKGILINNQIKFLENDNKMILDKNLNTLKRITETEEILFDYNNSTCTILDKKSNNKISFKIKVEKIKNQKDYFYVNYKIEEDCFEIEIRII